MSYERVAWGDFAPVGDLESGVTYLDETFALKNVAGVSDTPIEVGMTAMVNEEIVRVTEVGPLNAAGAPTWVKVARGCADTVPQIHAADSSVWFLYDEAAFDHTDYAGGEVLMVKLTPNTTSSAVPLDDAPTTTLTMDWRFGRPYPPGQMEHNGEHWFMTGAVTSDSPNLTLTWAHRNRVVQGDQLVDHLQPSIPPEPGTTYFAQVFRSEGDLLLRDEYGLTGETWTYTWAQAIADFGMSAVMEDDVTVHGYIEFGSFRDELESWQRYRLPITVNNLGIFMLMGHMGQQAMVVPGEGDDYLTEQPDLMINHLGTQTLVVPDEGDDYDTPMPNMLLGHLAYASGQETSYATPLNRNLFEAPYVFNLREEGHDPSTSRVVAVASRPSDRLTDEHMMYSRLAETEEVPAIEYEFRDRKTFTPWVTIKERLDFLTDTVEILASSFFDGVPVPTSVIGQMALVGTELVKVTGITSEKISLARGCGDTRPWQHAIGSRIWFVEQVRMVDFTTWPQPETPAENVTVQYKDVPVVLGPPLAMRDVPTDQVRLALRKERPYPPGNVRVNGKPWYHGAMTNVDETIAITWAHRNRLTQAGMLVDHEEASVPPEPGTTYKLSIQVQVTRSVGGHNVTSVVGIRSAEVSGRRYDYTWEMALQDGTRIGSLLDKCGAVTATMWLYAWRDDLQSWQGYPLLLRLPAPACPPGRLPGGDSGGWHNPPSQPGTGGNGETGNPPGGSGGGPGGPGGPVGPGDPNDPDGPGPGDPGGPGYDVGGDPHNNDGSGGNNGSGPPPPETPPEDWPDPIGPPDDDGDDEGGGGDPPEGDGSWDYVWDIFWAAYGEGYDPGNGDDDPGSGGGD